MGLKSFSREEDTAIVTLPNLLTGIRALGGVTLGVLLAFGRIEAIHALVLAAVLAATDAEGLVIRAAKRWPRVQHTLRLIPSRFGRAADPIVDKVFTGSIFIGGTIGGQIPLWQAIGILLVEAATSVTTFYVTQQGRKPQTSKSGSWGMVARCVTIACALAAAASEGSAHHILATSGTVAAVSAIVLGSLSCWKIYRTPIKE